MTTSRNSTPSGSVRCVAAAEGEAGRGLGGFFAGAIHGGPEGHDLFVVAEADPAAGEFDPLRCNIVPLERTVPSATAYKPVGIWLSLRA